MTTTIAQAIARSISHSEIVTLDAADLLAALAVEAGAHGDVATCQTIVALTSGEDEDREMATPAALSGLMRQLIDAIDSGDHRVEGDVRSGSVWEIWGESLDEDGDATVGGDWRVHIRLAGLTGVDA